MKKPGFLLSALSLFLLFSCPAKEVSYNNPEQEPPVQDKKKVLYIDSYDTSLPWVKGIMRGLLTELGISYNSMGEWDDSQSPVNFKVFHMNTKKNQSEAYINDRAAQVIMLIESWSPDLVIISDDNAMKYVIDPYYLNKKLPVVFCGINWSVEEYGLPAENITGMIEVQLIDQLVEELSHYARGSRVGFLKGDTLSSRKEGYYFQEALDKPLKNVFVTDFKSWKENFIAFQQEVDILLLGNLGEISDWDKDRSTLEQFIMEETLIPTGAWDYHESGMALITYATIPEEQGEWAARTALEILNGKNPSTIPLVKNIKTSSFLNMPLAGKMQIKFPQELIERSHLSGENKAEKRILFVNSYHKGYGWSDGIERGLMLVLEKSLLDFELRFIRMNTKINNSPEQIDQSVKRVIKEIDNWKPHIIVGSDDNFSKYVAQPYYYDKELPIIVCGLNGNASAYGFPTRNITGVEEFNDFEETIKKLKLISRGERAGALALDSFGEREAVTVTQERGVIFHDISYVSNWEEWKSEYLRLQKSVDLLILFSPVGIKDWEEGTAIDFIQKNTLIPSGITLEDQIQYALLGQAKIPEEQGWLAGEMVLKFFDGTPISEIPLTHNIKNRNLINISLANKLGIKIPQEILIEAELWNNQLGNP